MVKGVRAFGGASLVRIHDHGATVRLCCVCGDGEATAATGRHHILDVGKFSILTAERRTDDLSAVHGRSIR